MEDFLKIALHATLVLFFITGATYFVASTYSVMEDSEKKLLIESSNNITDIIANQQKGLLASHSQAWSFTLAILIFLSVILGYYGGLSSCCDPISIFFTILPLSASVILLGALGFLIISIVTGLSAFKGLIDAENAHIDVGLVRR
ncbi:MAG: hypothetical protein DRP18_05405 [Candidatus Aenigmatarchaeota archaeon]|nr:MAG: hypothetical protein DRP18_05405 [Candidatus Aenigmarchaeota archaeon]